MTEVTTGNIFADLGLDQPDELMSRAKLLNAVNTRIKQSALSQEELAIIKPIPWREAFKHGIEEFTESGLMLKGARAKKGLTKKQLAEALGVKLHHISEMEHGKRSIDEAMAHRLSKILDMGYRLFL